MKKITLLSLLIFVFSYSFAQHWVIQNSGVTTGILYKVFFVNDSVGFAVGNDAANNFILKTTNAGTTWVNKTVGVTKLIRSVFFISKDTGFIAGKQGAVYKTINGGDTWVDANPGTTIDFNDIYFVNKKKGFAIGKLGQVSYTTDGGVAWSSVNIGTSEEFSKIVFGNDTTGYLFSASSGKEWKTHTGGLTWDTLKTLPYKVNDASFTTGIFGYAVGPNGMVRHTINGVSTFWTTISPAGYSKKEFTSCFFFGTDGYIAGDSGILYTPNQGTFYLKDTVFTTQKIYSLYFPSKTTGYAVGVNGLIMKRVLPPVIKGINNLSGINKISIYPNPTDGKTNINLENGLYGNIDVAVTNIQGKIIIHKKLMTVPSSLELDLTPYPKGIYLLEINDSKNHYTNKIIRN